MNTSLQRATLPSSPRAIGVGTGLVHAVIAALLWTHFGFESLASSFAAEPLYVGYVVLGMFLLGFVPGALYARQHSVSPALLVVGLLALSGLATWQTVRTGKTPVGPTPFGWYVLLWVGIVALSGMLGSIEKRLRHYATA